MSSESSPAASSNHSTPATGSEVVVEVNPSEDLSQDHREIPTDLVRTDSPLSTSTSTGKRKDRDEEIPEEAKNDEESSNSSEIQVAKKLKIGSDTEDIPRETPATLAEIPTQTGKRKERDNESDDKGEDAQPEQHGSTPKRRRSQEKIGRQLDEISTQVDKETKTTSSPRCYLLSLPTELKIEILVLTGSPKYLLAASRTCHPLRRILLDESGQIIWRKVRKACTFYIWNGAHTRAREIKLPDPLPGLTEVKYAAFLFDSAKCEVCRHNVGWTFASFALRARLCKDANCSMPGQDICEIPLHVPQRSRKIAAIMTNESSRCFPNGSPTLYWPDTPTFYARRKKMQAILDRFPDLDNLTAGQQIEFDLLVEQKNKWMKFYVDLHKWQAAAQEQFRLTRSKNDSTASNIASKFGWSLSELQRTVFQELKKHKDEIREEITETDVCMIKDQIEEGILVAQDKTGRRKGEITLQRNRKDAEHYYHTLRSAKQYPYLPSLATFRRLPVIEMLQSSSANNVSDALNKDRMIQELLKGQIEKWSNTAKAELAVTLGFPKNWKNANKNVLHPVERVTARFVCKKCKRLDDKHKMDGCLDFAGACLHECGIGNEKKGRIAKGKKAVWKADNFVRDEKAINILKKTIDNLGYAEDRDAANYIHKVGLAAVCKSCEREMVLDSRSIIGHCHRHEDMEIYFPPLETVVSYLGGFPYEYGLSRSLLGYGAMLNAGKTEINRVNFGCRHCLRETQETNTATSSALPVDPDNSDNAPITIDQSSVAASKIGIELSSVVHRMHDVGIAGPYGRPPRLFTFNGMRSHLKEKHHIEDVRDEDFLCYHPVEFQY